MNPIEIIDPRRVKYFKCILRGVAAGCREAGDPFELLEMATAAEEFAADLRKESAEKFKESADEPKTFPEWIGGE